ncbi:armadillo-type protein [Mycena capillaripes]|nr:armadillo-type protein [Mycena capillaripes]
MSEFNNRAADSEIDARMVVDSPVFHFIVEMLESPDGGVPSSSSTLLGTLASHECTAPAVIALKPSVQLVSLLRDKYIDVILGAVYALSQIARWPDGAQDIVDARALEHVMGLLQSPSRRIRRWTCQLVGRLADHDSTAPAVVELNLPGFIMSLIRSVPDRRRP